MNPDEVHVVYSVNLDKILSVHADRVLALARINKLKKDTHYAINIVCDLDTAIEFLIRKREKENG